MNICDAVSRELGTSRDVLPERDDNKFWQRLDCVFCDDDRASAAVSYRLNWYQCYRASCGKVVCCGTGSAAERFQFQIGQAVRNTRQKYGRWLKDWELRPEAEYLVTNYDLGKPGGKNDAGSLPDWELAVKYDPGQLDRYVLQALNCDLLDWAKTEVRRKRKRGEYEIPVGDDIERMPSSRVAAEPEEWFTVENFPYSSLVAEGFTQSEIATRMGVSLATVKRRLSAEKDQLARYV